MDTSILLVNEMSDEILKVTTEAKEALFRAKKHSKETYSEVILRLLGEYKAREPLRQQWLDEAKKYSGQVLIKTQETDKVHCLDMAVRYLIKVLSPGSYIW